MNATPGTKVLPSKAAKLLYQGDSDNLYAQDPFRLAMAILAHAANVGFDAEILFQLLMDPSNPGGEFYRRMRYKAPREFDRHFAKAQATRVQDASQIRAKLSLAAQTVQASTLPSSARSVLLAHIQAAIEVGCVKYARSIRSLAETCGLSVKTTHKWTRELVHKGLLTKRGERKGLVSTKYSIRMNEVMILGTIGTTLPGDGIVGEIITSVSQHPVWQHGSGYSEPVYRALDREVESTVQDVAERSNKTAQTVRVQLKKMEVEGLAVRVSRTLWLKIGDSATLDRIAERDGLVDKGKKLRVKHEAERAEFRVGYRAYCERMARERTSEVWVESCGEGTVWNHVDTKTGELIQFALPWGIGRMERVGA